MNKRFYPFAALLVLILASMACASPLSTAPSHDQVATVVALTMQAMTPSGSESTATTAPEAGLLPHSLYYLDHGSNVKLQDFRKEKDGKTVHQVTSETADVGPFDVSLVDGRVAYAANNQLIVINPDGSTRTVLL